jgi:ArsR family transcriptional regulator
MRNLTNAFKALSDETRLQMLGLLFQAGELCVCDFVEVLEITQSKASRHLRYLVNAGLVDDRREAVWVYFRITETPDPDTEKMLSMLPELLEGNIQKGLIERLEAWQKQKHSGAASCGA